VLRFADVPSAMTSSAGRHLSDSVVMPLRLGACSLLSDVRPEFTSSSLLVAGTTAMKLLVGNYRNLGTAVTEKRCLLVSRLMENYGLSNLVEELIK